MVEDAASHERFLRLAIDLAEERARQGAGGPFGALVVREGCVVGTGFNAVVALGDPTAHAEVQAIRDACARLGTYRLDRCDLYASCEPCPMCLGAIYWARLRTVYFAGTRTDGGRRSPARWSVGCCRSARHFWFALEGFPRNSSTHLPRRQRN